MVNIGLLVIDDGRKEKLAETIASAKENLDWDQFKVKVMVNDSGDNNYHDYLVDTYLDDKFFIISHNEREGLASAVIDGWNLVSGFNVDYVFHLEDDFIFNQKVNLHDLIDILHNNSHLAQIVLKRASVNPAEEAAGGYIQQRPELYIQQDGYIEQNNLFTLNPCMYPANIIKVGWPEHGGEREFTDKLLIQDPELKFGIIGDIEDSPIVTHIGSHRSEGWKL